VTPETPIARFLFSSGHCTATRVREGAFLPPADLNLSVAVADDMDATEARNIAATYLETAERRCKGYATLNAECFIGQSLPISRDDTPYFRRANVCGWPSEKPRQKAIAQHLAENSKLHLFTAP